MAIPKAIRNKIADLNIEDTVIDWSINENNEIIIKPRKKVSLDDVLDWSTEDGKMIIESIKLIFISILILPSSSYFGVPTTPYSIGTSLKTYPEDNSNSSKI